MRIFLCGLFLLCVVDSANGMDKSISGFKDSIIPNTICDVLAAVPASVLFCASLCSPQSSVLTILPYPHPGSQTSSWCMVAIVVLRGDRLKNSLQQLKKFDKDLLNPNAQKEYYEEIFKEHRLSKVVELGILCAFQIIGLAWNGHLTSAKHWVGAVEYVIFTQALSFAALIPIWYRT